MFSQLQTYIRTHALFRPGDRVGVAVSGGADSVALLRALLELREKLGIVLSVIHLHHGIRGEEADADEQFVTDLAKQFDLPLHVDRADVPAHSAEEKLSLETAARDLRYAFFRRLLESNACDKIATAHTLDDQAETVLIRLLRGTGTRGLAAIPPFRDASPDLAARIVRPLLRSTHTDLEIYLRSLNQPWREDSSNSDPKFLRNRIRHALLPFLETEYNPALRQSLVNLAEIARAEEERWESQLVDQRRLATGNDIDRTALLELPLALQRRLLVDHADRLDVPVTFEDIELMLRMAAKPGSEHSFEGGWLVSSTKQQLLFQRISTSPGATRYDLPLSLDQATPLPNSTHIRATLVSAPDTPRYNPFALLAYDRLQLPLRVGNWQPGDRFWPAGSKQSEKLKRLFAERHIPADARLSWPVVLSGDTIVWVKDFPVAREFQAEQQDAVLIEAVESRQV